MYKKIFCQENKCKLFISSSLLALGFFDLSFNLARAGSIDNLQPELIMAQGTSVVTDGAGTFRSEGSKIFFYPSDGSNEVRVYNGSSQRALAIVTFRGAVYTAFSGGGIYRSPDGQNLGGGGSTYPL